MGEGEEEEEGGGDRRGVKLKPLGNGETHLAESRTARGDKSRRGGEQEVGVVGGRGGGGERRAGEAR